MTKTFVKWNNTGGFLSIGKVIISSAHLASLACESSLYRKMSEGMEMIMRKGSLSSAMRVGIPISGIGSTHVRWPCKNLFLLAGGAYLKLVEKISRSILQSPLVRRRSSSMIEGETCRMYLLSRETITHMVTLKFPHKIG